MLNADQIRHAIHQVIELQSDPMLITGTYIISRAAHKFGLSLAEVNKDYCKIYDILFDMIDSGELVITPVDGRNYYSLGRMN